MGNQALEVQPFDEWAIVEVMGHQRYAGRVTEQTIGGAAFIRIDVPVCGNVAAYSKLLSPSAIFSITPTSESIARDAVKHFRSPPLSIFDFDFQPRLPGLQDDADAY